MFAAGMRKRHVEVSEACDRGDMVRALIFTGEFNRLTVEANQFVGKLARGPFDLRGEGRVGGKAVSGDGGSEEANALGQAEGGRGREAEGPREPTSAGSRKGGKRKG